MKTKIDAIITLSQAGWTAEEIKALFGDDGQAEPVIMPPVQPLPHVPAYPVWPGWYDRREQPSWPWYPPYVITTTAGNTSGLYYSYIGDEQ